MSVKTNVSPKRLLGILRKGPSSFNARENSGTEFAAEIWREFVGKLIANGIPVMQDLYGVSWPADEQTPPQEIFYFCGFESNQKDSAFEELMLEGGNYFDYLCETPADNLDAGFKAAYMEALPNSGLSPRDGQHLEIYGREYDPNSKIAKFRILIPVQ